MAKELQPGALGLSVNAYHHKLQAENVPLVLRTLFQKKSFHEQ